MPEYISVCGDLVPKVKYEQMKKDAAEAAKKEAATKVDVQIAEAKKKSVTKKNSNQEKNKQLKKGVEHASVCI